MRYIRYSDHNRFGMGENPLILVSILRNRVLGKWVTRGHCDQIGRFIAQLFKAFVNN